MNAEILVNRGKIFTSSGLLICGGFIVIADLLMADFPVSCFHFYRCAESQTVISLYACVCAESVKLVFFNVSFTDLSAQSPCLISLKD